MSHYGQYCPVAQALEVIGDRWTLLIIRDMLTGTRRFNDMQRRLPGLSRALLAKRLRQLQASGVITKRSNGPDERSGEYCLTDAGLALQPVIESLLVWGAGWAFGEPTPEQLDPLLLMWWMHDRVNVDQLPEQRVVVQFEFYGAASATYWLVLDRADVTLCVSHPGFDIDLLVTADLAAFFRVWLGRIQYNEALESNALKVDGIPRLARDLPRWFALSPAAPAVAAARLSSDQ